MCEVSDLRKEIEERLNDKKTARENRIKNGDFFNIYDLCGIGAKENIHSNIIAEFLNPQWQHGQGNIFLKKFCERLGIAFDSTQETTVTREEVIPDRRPDIVIRNGSKLIVIENKTRTCDHEEQLQDYWNWMSNCRVTHKTLIYLTKAGEHPRCNFKIDNVYNKETDSGDNVSSCTSYGNDENKFILLPYSEIQDWCACCSIIPGLPDNVADAFSQYANFIERWDNNETDDEDIIAFCAQGDNLDKVHKICLSGETDNTIKWVKENYNRIIKTYIASQFSCSGWNNNILKLKEIDKTIFNICVEVNTNKFGCQFVLIGITQLGTNTYYSEYSRNLKECFKKFKRKQSGDNCWWIVHQEIENIKECNLIKNNIDNKIEAVKNLLKRNDLQEIFSSIKVSRNKGK